MAYALNEHPFRAFESRRSKSKQVPRRSFRVRLKKMSRRTLPRKSLEAWMASTASITGLK